MKKLISFLILTIALIVPLKANASSKTFYEAEYINNIWMNRKTTDGRTIYYQRARFFRETNTNAFAYCVEPFAGFTENYSYNETLSPYNLTEEQKNKIMLLSHFGYQYKNHTDDKWYAITQMLIWKASTPNADFYFTDSLNGNRIDKFQPEITEINNLIEHYNKKPSFDNSTYSIVLGEQLNIKDKNEILRDFSIDSPYAKIEEDNLIITNLSVGKHTIILEKKDNYYNSPIIFYQSDNSQNLVETGDLDPIISKIDIIVQETTVNINKLDYDTNSTQSSGEGILYGASFQLMDINQNTIQEINFDNTLEQTIKNLAYGKYYLKEIKAGLGYKIDEDIHEFELTPENNEITLKLENIIIKSTVELNKSLEYNDSFLPEANINFNIYNHTGQLVETIITDENGHAKATLPYGTYKIEQQNTTNGYEKVEPFYITINTEEVLTFNLIDYKIKVPNTSYNILKDIIKIIRKVIFLCLNILYFLF